MPEKPTERQSAAPERPQLEIVDAEIIEDPVASTGHVTGGDRLAGDLGIAPVTVDVTGRQGWIAPGLSESRF